MDDSSLERDDCLFLMTQYTLLPLSQLKKCDLIPTSQGSALRSHGPAEPPPTSPSRTKCSSTFAPRNFEHHALWPFPLLHSEPLQANPGIYPAFDFMGWSACLVPRRYWSNTKWMEIGRSFPFSTRKMFPLGEWAPNRVCQTRTEAQGSHARTS